MKLQQKLKLLPDKTGVYLMRDGAEKIIYVGKALSLKKRVRSYFRGRNHSVKVAALVKNVKDLEWILTDSEVEALILECNLIKEHRPRYNVSLKDDKTYPYLKVSVQEEFPRVSVTRSKQKDGARYFGPYTRAGAMRDTLRLLRRIFPLRNCKNSEFGNRDRPCLNAHIRRCSAPCTGEVAKAEYDRIVQEVILFLEGRHETLARKLKLQMQQAAEKLEYEKAAELRDQIAALEEVLSKQKIVSKGLEDQDVLAFARAEGNEACAQVFFVRGGKVTGRAHFFLEAVQELSRSEIMTEFVKRFYSESDEIPREVLLQEPVTEHEIIEKWLSGLRGQRVYLKIPRRGDKLKLVEMVHKNALMLLQERETMQQKREAMTEGALLELAKALKLEELPRRIECYDISNIQGSNAVGSMVVFHDGKPATGQYRRFKIKTVKGPNDYASLQEVLERRFKRAAEENNNQTEAKFGRLPQLLIVDGGRGQLNSALEVMQKLGVSDIPTFGLAKQEELLFREGEAEPIRLPRDSEALYLVQRIRDEAHRFAVSYHRQLRSKESIRSVLDEIPGVGPKRKKALLKAFGSVKEMKKASLEELQAVDGITAVLAEELYNYLKGI